MAAILKNGCVYVKPMISRLVVVRFSFCLILCIANRNTLNGSLRLYCHKVNRLAAILKNVDFVFALIIYNVKPRIPQLPFFRLSSCLILAKANMKVFILFCNKVKLLAAILKNGDIFLTFY